MNEKQQLALAAGLAQERVGRRRQIVCDGWQGPTLTPQDGNRPPIVDYSTWVCPHTPACLHPMPCWQRYMRERT